jgi:hypothetical protein
MVLIAATYAYIAVEENDLTEDMNPPHEITCKVFSNIFRGAFSKFNGIFFICG